MKRTCGQRVAVLEELGGSHGEPRGLVQEGLRGAVDEVVDPVLVLGQVPLPDVRAEASGVIRLATASSTDAAASAVGDDALSRPIADRSPPALRARERGIEAECRSSRSWAWARTASSCRRCSSGGQPQRASRHGSHSQSTSWTSRACQLS